MRLNIYYLIGGVVTLAIPFGLLALLLAQGAPPVALHVMVLVAATVAGVLLFYSPAISISFRDGEVVVRGLVREVVYRCKSVEEVPRYPHAFCPFGNRGAFGWWGTCWRDGRKFYVYATLKCTKWYKVVTVDGEEVYVCP